MESVDLQACLGFLQAIHYSAKIANVNKDICQNLSCVVGRVRPCLEEVDMTEHENVEQHSSELRLIATSLQSIHVAITRFSTMGFLQSVLEAHALCENFSNGRDTLVAALENLATKRATSSTKDWKVEIERLCQFLKGLRFEDCDHLRVAKRVHATARKIIDGEMPHKSGQVLIRSQLLADSNISSKAMQEEIQGLERELSRARVEKQQHEVEELHTIILALKQSTSDAEQESRPQPPVEYLCPISHAVMRDPVVLVETGQTYDRRYIEEWFNRGNRTCPATKQSVTELHLTPNYALKSLASSWLNVNSTGEKDEDEDSIQFHRTDVSSAVPDFKKLSTIDGPQKLPPSCEDAGGYGLTVECGYAAMEMPHVSQAFKSTPSSVDSSSLIAKKDLERNSGDSRDSYVGRNQLFSTSKEDLKQRATKVVDVVDAQKPSMQAANVVVNPLASAAGGNTPLSYGSVRSEGGKMGVPALALNSLASKFPRVARAHGKCVDIMETRSTDHCDASTPRSSYSELPKRMSSRDNIGLNDAMQTLLQARRLKFEVQEEQTPRSAKSTSKILFRADGKTAQSKCGLPSSMRPRNANHGPPSVCSATSRASRDREMDLRQYDELDKVENGSDAGSEQQPTDEAEEEWVDNADFDVASLTTIGSYGPKYASSIVSMRPAAKKGSNFCSGFMQGATNVLFGDNEDDDDEGNASGMEEEDANDVSLPVLANLLKTNDTELAASLASDLAIKAQTDAAILQDIPRLDIVPSLVKLLESSSSAVKSAAARALGVMGERSPEAKMQILNCGAVPILSRLNKQSELEKDDSHREEGSLEDVAAATRFALSALSMNTNQAPSIDVSPQMLVALLSSPDEDMQASAVLDLLEKCKSAGAEMVLKELTESDVLLSLVDMLEHPEDDVQFAAAEILSLMIYSDQKTQRELSQSIGIVSKLLRLIKQGGPDCISCKSAATQVIRGLAHNNSKIREDVLKRGVIPEFASLLCCNDPQTRETAAWMLGIMASHSKNGQNEVANCDQAMFVLDELATNGLAQEKVAAKFALRAVGGEGGCDDEDELSTPIVIQSLQAGAKEVKIAAAWELCRLANSNQWSQVEIYECGGVTALLAYLKARPGLDGIQACLSTLVKLSGAEARIAAQISQEGGVLIAVRLLKSPAVPDKKLVVQLLTILAEKCPVHQHELLSNGAVPVLVDLLFSEEGICKAAYEALSCLVENDMSVVCGSVTEVATPTLLDIAANEESPTFSKKAAIQLLGKMGEATFDCQQIVVQQGGVELLMQIMQDGEDPEVMIATTKAVKSLSKKAFRDQGTGHMHRLVQILETSATHRRPNATGLVRMNEYVPKSPMTTGGCYSSSASNSTPDQPQRLGRKPSIVPPIVLPVVPESVGEESEVDDTDDTQSATIQAPESPVSHTTYEPTPKHTPFNVCCNDAFSDGRESSPDESDHCKIKCMPAPSVASSGQKRPSSTRSGGINEPRRVAPTPAHKKDLKELNSLVENIRRCDAVHAPQSDTRNVIGELRNLASTNRSTGSHLLKTGAVGMLIDRLRTHSYR